MNEKRILEMDSYEQKVLANILNDKRKSLIEENKDNDFIDEILEKVIDAPIKKKSLFKKEKRDERLILCYIFWEESVLYGLLY